MDALWAIKTRRSIRSYLQKPVEFDKVTAVIEAAHYAPSAGNLQDWKFIIITDKAARHAIAEHCLEQHWMAHAPVYIVVCSNEERTEMRYGLRGKRLYSVQSCAAATENMLLAAHALGLGACWVGAFDEDYLDRTLNIPDTARAQAIVTLGYTDEQPGEKELTSLDSAVYFGTYGIPYEKPHLILKDYSVEWEQQAQKAKPALEKGIASIKKSVQQLKEKVRPPTKEEEELPQPRREEEAEWKG
ncbi:nitroreductase family protein [Candidatus Woesearchaeota archaeon]|nr:nitroreductase family protein [Candidatus Woesearchaeota archaeon]